MAETIENPTQAQRDEAYNEWDCARQIVHPHWFLDIYQSPDGRQLLTETPELVHLILCDSPEEADLTIAEVLAAYEVDA